MRLLTIARTYLKQTFSSRSVLIMSLLMPLLFTFVLAAGMNSMASDATAKRTLIVVDEDRSPASAMLLERLRAAPDLALQSLPREEALQEVDSGSAPAALLIPPGFDKALEGGRDTATLTLYRSAKDALEAQAVSQTVRAALAEVEAIFGMQAMAVQVAETVGVLPSAPAARSDFASRALAAAQALWESARPLTVKVSRVTRLNQNEVPIGGAQSSPGMMVMFALFLTFGGGASLVVERERGTLRRLLVMPVRKSEILGGKLLGIIVGVLVQMLIMVLAGAVGLGVPWGKAPVALGVMLVAYAFASTALGVLVAALVRTAAQADSLGTILVMALSALGGAWWPIEIVPHWMQTLARALPTYWAMQGFQDIIVRGLGLSAVLPKAAVLVAFGVGFLVVGVWRFRFE